MKILQKVAITLTFLPLFCYIWNVGKGILCQALGTWSKRFCFENCVEAQMCQPCSVIAWFIVMNTWEEAFWTEFLCFRVLGMLQLCNLVATGKFGFGWQCRTMKIIWIWSKRTSMLTPPTFILWHLDALVALFWMPICAFVIVDWTVFSTFYNLLLIEFGRFAKLLKYT